MTGRPSVNKRQRELLRKERQAEKVTKRDERRVKRNDGPGEELTEMEMLERGLLEFGENGELRRTGLADADAAPDTKVAEPGQPVADVTSAPKLAEPARPVADVAPAPKLAEPARPAADAARATK